MPGANMHDARQPHRKVELKKNYLSNFLLLGAANRILICRPLRSGNTVRPSPFSYTTGMFYTLKFWESRGADGKRADAHREARWRYRRARSEHAA